MIISCGGIHVPENSGSAQSLSSDLTSFPGSATLVNAGRADRGVTMGANMRLAAGSGGAVTLTGTLAQTLPILITVRTAGTVGAFTFDITIDGGVTAFAAGVLSSSSYAIGSTGITVNFAAGSYTSGTVYRAIVKQIVDYKSGFVFAQATDSLCPALVVDYANRPTLLFDGTSQILPCTTAGVASWANGANAAFTLLQVFKYDSQGFFSTGWITAFDSAGTSRLDSGELGSNWAPFRKSSGGGASNPSSASAGSAGTQYVSMTSCPGTTVSVVVNGTNVMAAQGFAAGGQTLACNTMAIGFGNVPGSQSYCVSEWGVYSSDQSASLASALAYLTSPYRSPGRRDTGVATSFFDSAPGTPAGQSPNNIHIRQSLANLRFSIGAGVTSFSVTAVPGTYAPVGQLVTTVDVFLDGSATPAQTLSFTGPQGYAQTIVCTLDGSAHTVLLEESVPIQSISVTPNAPTAPNTRVAFCGDSIIWGFNASARKKSSVSLTRHALSASTYGVTVQGIPGQTMGQVAGSGPLVSSTAALWASFLDGSSKNIAWLELGVNDYFGGIVAGTFQTQLSNLVTAILALKPAAKLVLQSPTSLPSEGANSGGSTLPNFRTAVQAVVTANASSCTYVDGSTILNSGTDLSDGIHPNDVGYGKVSAVMVTAISAL